MGLGLLHQGIERQAEVSLALRNTPLSAIILLFATVPLQMLTGASIMKLIHDGVIGLLC